ncbi:MAG: OadG family protein [Desulfobacterales bacterium]
MDNLTFGLTLMVVGMGGTLVTLALLAVIMNLLKKIFPVREDQQSS